MGSGRQRLESAVEAGQVSLQPSYIPARQSKGPSQGLPRLQLKYPNSPNFRSWLSKFSGSHFPDLNNVTCVSHRLALGDPAISPEDIAHSRSCLWAPPKQPIFLHRSSQGERQFPQGRRFSTLVSFQAFQRNWKLAARLRACLYPARPHRGQTPPPPVHCVRDIPGSHQLSQVRHVPRV